MVGGGEGWWRVVEEGGGWWWMAEAFWYSRMAFWNLRRSGFLDFWHSKLVIGVVEGGGGWNLRVEF